MDIDSIRPKPSQTVTASPPRPPSPPPPSPESPFVEEQKESSLPYLAKLTAFIILFLSVLYSLSTLIAYLVEKLLVKESANNYDYSYFSGLDSFMVISAVATLIVALPVSALLLFWVRRSEKNNSWRASQKWRRVIYTVTQIILLLTVVSTIIGTVYSVFSYSLDLDVSTSYYGSESPKDEPSVSSKIAASVISGVVAVVIFCLGIVTLVGEYASKWRSLAWGVLVLFAIVGGVVGVSSIGKVQESIKKQKDTQSKYEDTFSGASSDSSTLDSQNSSLAKSDLTAVQGDLAYYASSNGGKYPTKTQWDDGSLKPKYLLSSDTTLKKITYAPEGCEAAGCKSYTISMKDEKGETIERSSSDNSY